MTDRKIPAAILAVTVHLILLAVLVFGFRWQESEPVVLQAQIWQDIPSVQSAPPQPAPRPVPQPVPVPPPKPVPKPTPAPVQKPEVEKPDIALRKAREEKLKQEKLKEQKQKEQKQKEQKQKEQKQKEQKQKEQKQKELEKQKQDKQKQIEKQKELQKQTLEKQMRQAQQEKIDALNRMMQQRAAAAKSSLIDKYKAMIHNRIKRFVVVPPDLKGNPEAEFTVVLLPDGEVLKATLVKSSGYPAYDAAVERAILRASPLPLPPDASLFDEFRTLDLHFRPSE